MQVGLFNISHLKAIMSSTAPPLTLENLFDAVKGVTNWRNFGWRLLGYKVYDIERQHASDEDRLKASVESFLLGKGDYQPTWRRVIHALHKAYESVVASDITTYAEAIEGE